jgi:Ca2+-transporting ATPase
MTVTETGARPSGLSTAEAAARIAQDGPNAVAKPRPRRLIARIGAQLTDPLVLLLLAAAIVTVALGDWPDVAIILLVIALNTVIGVVQEVRADRAIAALDDLAAPTAHVVRDGRSQTIPAADLVRGDVVNVEAGVIVPADLSLVDAFRCQVDEAALTGESLPVVKDAGEELQAGTVVVTGRASGVVIRTGSRSALGGIASLVATTRGGPTPLQRRLARLGRVIGLAAVALCFIVFGLGVVAGQPVITMALVAVSLVVAAVPESLPAVVTLALALGARRMAQHKAIPRNLHAVETLGSVTVLASDKTGTLTEGRMTVHEAVPTRALDELAEAAVLCCDAVIEPNGDPDRRSARRGAGRLRGRAWPRSDRHPGQGTAARRAPVRSGHAANDDHQPGTRRIPHGLQRRPRDRADRADRGGRGHDRQGAASQRRRACGTRPARYRGGRGHDGADR